MGGRKAEAPSFDGAPSGTAPHPSPPHRKRGEGEARADCKAGSTPRSMAERQRLGRDAREAVSGQRDA